MAGGEWETVVSKSRKNKNLPNAKNVKEKNKKIENAKLVNSGPISESVTLFSAFLEKEKESPKPKNNSIKGKDNSNSIKGKESSSQPKKKKDKKANSTTSKFPSFESIVNTISEEEVKNLLAAVEARFPEFPMIWLKDLASFYSIKFDIPIQDPLFASKPIGYPCSKLSEGLYAQMVKIFNRCSTNVLCLFFEQCLNFMVQDIIKVHNTLGYQLILQCLAQEFPYIVMKSLSVCTKLCNTHQNRHNVCFSIFWAALQAGNKDLETGIQVWIKLVFPFIGMKLYSSYAVDSLERLLSNHDVSGIKESIIEVKELFPILDFIYAKDSNQPLKKRLSQIYPKLKILSYGSQPGSILSNYFPLYLRRLEPHCTSSLKKEILTSLIQCLEQDTLSYSVWRQLYTKHLMQSKILIKHINDEWMNLSPHFPKRHLRDTLLTFQVTNEELLIQGTSKTDVNQCIAVSKELLSKMNTQMFPWLKMCIWCIFILSTLIVYDIISHGSFYESKVGHFMKDTGLLFVYTKASEKIAFYSNKAYSWLEVNVPVYVKWVQKKSGPYFEQFFQELVNWFAFCWKSTENLRMWFSKNIPPMLNKIDKEMPLCANKLYIVIENLFAFIFYYGGILVESLIYLGSLCIHWFNSNVDVEYWYAQFLDKSAIFINVLQNQTSRALYFINDLISPLFYSK